MKFVTPILNEYVAWYFVTCGKTGNWEIAAFDNNAQVVINSCDSFLVIFPRPMPVDNETISL